MAVKAFLRWLVSLRHEVAPFTNKTTKKEKAATCDKGTYAFSWSRCSRCFTRRPLSVDRRYQQPADPCRRLLTVVRFPRSRARRRNSNAPSYLSHPRLISVWDFFIYFSLQEARDYWRYLRRRPVYLLSRG